MSRIHESIIATCENGLGRHGDNYLGVGWTKKPGYADLRYRVMLEGIRPEWPTPLTLLDFGCGASHLLEYIQALGREDIHYSGLDLSDKYLALSRKKFPDTQYLQRDMTAPGSTLPEFDYIVMNGLLNYRGSATNDAMWDYCQSLLGNVGRFARCGFAFNIMTKYLDWERDDLFHMPLEKMADFLTARFGRNFTIRHDYGLYEYTVYVYTHPLSDYF